MLSLAILRCHSIVIHYSRVSSDSIIAASAVEKGDGIMHVKIEEISEYKDIVFI